MATPSISLIASVTSVAAFPAPSEPTKRSIASIVAWKLCRTSLVKWRSNPCDIHSGHEIMISSYPFRENTAAHREPIPGFSTIKRSNSSHPHMPVKITQRFFQAFQRVWTGWMLTAPWSLKYNSHCSKQRVHSSYVQVTPTSIQTILHLNSLGP